jgi:pyruvate dehydrogenase E2 component (dihydrolipoamide acetyltransferase)
LEQLVLIWLCNAVAFIGYLPMNQNSEMIHEFKLPSLGDGVVGKVTEVLVKSGDTLSLEQIVIIVGTDKVDAEMPIDVAGVVESIAVKKGDEVKEGDLILKVKVADSAGSAAPAPAPVAPPPVETIAPPSVVAAPVPVASAPVAAAVASSAGKRISPLARKRAKELGINMSDITVSTDAVRISYRDVIDFAKGKMTGGAAATGGSVAHKALPDFAKYGEIDRKPMSRINELVADNLTYTWSTTPHAWMMEKADITHLEELRNAHKERVKAQGGALTTTSILVKAVISVLKKFPQINATLDLAKKEIVFKNYYHIGVAVDTPKGLMVPVIKDADKKGLIEISKDLSELSVRTRDGKNLPGDMEGSTFSISNVGGIGSTSIMPIVNWPNSAILGITAAQKEAVWNEEKAIFEPRLMMPMTLAFDHRLINGADASRFLRELKLVLEEPFLSWF